MSDKKQMMDVEKYQSVAAALSDENQRRWSDDLLNRKANDSKYNYDPTRTHLNFEVVKGGRIQPVEKSVRIDQKVEAAIKERVTGRVNAVSIRAVSIIFGGNRERMRELAFGNQVIDEDKHNDHITRHPDIERWAQDIYRFACKEWGEENIVSFVVHLDEVNPHVHCMMVPITPDGRLSAKEMIGGKDKAAASKRMNEIHTRLAEVNRKWGLERGDSIRETGNKHRSLENYRRDLSREIVSLEQTVSSKQGELDDIMAQIHRAEIKVKSFTTMIENLEQKKEFIEDEIERLKELMESHEGENKEIAQKIVQKCHELEKCNSDLLSRRQMLRNVNAQLTELNESVRVMNLQKRHLERVLNDIPRDVRLQSMLYLSTGGFHEVIHEFAQIFPKLSTSDKMLFEETLIHDLAERANTIMNCAMGLFAHTVEAATAYAESQGGGGVAPDSGWGKKDDEEEWEYARRCMRMTARMMRTPAKKKVGMHR